MIRFLNRLQPWAIALLRIVLGVGMTVHGWQHTIPPGGLHRSHPLAGIQAFNHYVVTLGMRYWLGYISVVTEFIGGIFVVLGLLTRFWAMLITGNMLIALIEVNIHRGYFGSEYSLALIAMSCVLVAAGSGELSLDRRFNIS